LKTIKINSLSTKLIAHRGLSGFEKENTHAAFIAAGAKGYYATECDIHLTKDNEFVVFHDFSTARVATVDKVIQDSTLEELRELALNDLETDVASIHLRIPTLNEYLIISKKYEMKCFIEIKPSMNLPQIKNLLIEINNHDYKDNTWIISFDYQNLKNIRQLDETIKLQYLTGEYRNNLLESCLAINAGLDINHQAVSSELVESFHKHNLEVNAWTVNDSVNAENLLNYGVDYITTNILEGI
jgi:glycerophosphoryl diester phosphodiesterase